MRDEERRAYDTDAWALLRRDVAAGCTPVDDTDSAMSAEMSALMGEDIDMCLGLAESKALLWFWDRMHQGGVVASAGAVEEVPAWARLHEAVAGGSCAPSYLEEAGFTQLMDVLAGRAGAGLMDELGLKGEVSCTADGLRDLVRIWDYVRGLGAPVAQTPQVEPAWLAAHRRGEATEGQSREAQEAIIARVVELSGVAALSTHSGPGHLRSIVSPYGGVHSRTGCEAVVRVWEWLAAGAPRTGRVEDTEAVTALRALVARGAEEEERATQGMVVTQALDMLARRAGVASLSGILRAGSPGWSPIGQRRLLRLWDWLASPSAAGVTVAAASAPAQSSAAPSAELRERIAQMRRMVEREIAYGSSGWNRETLSLLLAEAPVREALLADTHCGRGILNAIVGVRGGRGLVAHEYRLLLESVDAALSPLTPEERAELKRLTAEVQRIEARRDELARKARGEA